MKKQKGNTLLMILIIAVVILVGGYLFYQKGLMPSMNQTQQSNAIQNDGELQNASDELDNTSIDSMDMQLNQNTTDAASF